MSRQVKQSGSFTEQDVVQALRLYNRPASITELYELIVNPSKRLSADQLIRDKTFNGFRVRLKRIIADNPKTFRLDYPYPFPRNKAAVSLISTKDPGMRVSPDGVQSLFRTLQGRETPKPETPKPVSTWEDIIIAWVNTLPIQKPTKNTYRQQCIQATNWLFKGRIPDSPMDVDKLILQDRHLTIPFAVKAGTYAGGSLYTVLSNLNRVSYMAKSNGKMRFTLDQAPAFRYYLDSLKQQVNPLKKPKAKQGRLSRIWHRIKRCFKST